METNNRETVSLDEGLGSIIFSILRGKVDTVTVGIVESYDPSNQTVSVQPAIMRRRENEDEAKPRPVIEDVRVVFPGSGDFWLTFPINQGDPVLLLAPSRSLDVWMDSGGVVDPDSTRIFDLSDAVAIPGILDDGSVIDALEQDGIYLQKKDGTKYLRVTEDGIDALGDMEVDGNLTVTGSIEATGNITTTTGNVNVPAGDVTASGTVSAATVTAGTVTGSTDVVGGGVSLANHTHTVNGTAALVTPGTGSSAVTGTTTPPV